MPAKFINSFSYREFDVKVAEFKAGDLAVAAYSSGDPRPVAEIKGKSIEEVESEIKRVLKEKSTSYIGLDEAIKMFLRAFPKGFNDDLYLSWEREYKLEASAFVTEQLSQASLDDLIGSRNFEEACTQVRRAYSKTNLISPFESARLLESARKPSNQEPFVRAIYAFLYGDNLGHGIQAMVHVLKPHGAATWPIVSYLPYLRFPERHMFLKPEVGPPPEKWSDLNYVF
jgi:hypothetical protein